MGVDPPAPRCRTHAADLDHMGVDPQPTPPNTPFPAGRAGQRASDAPVACPAVTLGPAELHRRTCSSSHGELGIAPERPELLDERLLQLLGEGVVWPESLDGLADGLDL